MRVRKRVREITAGFRNSLDDYLAKKGRASIREGPHGPVISWPLVIDPRVLDILDTIDDIPPKHDFRFSESYDQLKIFLADDQTRRDVTSVLQPIMIHGFPLARQLAAAIDQIAQGIPIRGVLAFDIDQVDLFINHDGAPNIEGLGRIAGLLPNTEIDYLASLQQIADIWERAKAWADIFGFSYPEVLLFCECQSHWLPLRRPPPLPDLLRDAVSESPVKCSPAIQVLPSSEFTRLYQPLVKSIAQGISLIAPKICELDELIAEGIKGAQYASERMQPLDAAEPERVMIFYINSAILWRLHRDILAG